MKMATHENIPYLRVLFEEAAMDYPIGQSIYSNVMQAGREIGFLKSHNRVTSIPGKDVREAFFQGKNTLVVGVRKGLEFASCKPSAHFQIPLVTGCSAICEYCYLNTNLGKKPYTRVYVNIEDILMQVNRLIEERKPQTTIFEASATADPVPVESLGGTLSKTINFFADQEYGRLRIATKFPCPDSLLSSRHEKHTRIRYTINSENVIRSSERRTPPLAIRFRALNDLIDHDFPAGIMIAPVFLEKDWQSKYKELLLRLREELPVRPGLDLHFEIISHRFTIRARNIINQVFPGNVLPMDEKTGRRFVYGQFGYGKYVYEPERLEEMKAFFHTSIADLFPEAEIEYVI